MVLALCWEASFASVAFIEEVVDAVKVIRGAEEPRLTMTKDEEEEDAFGYWEDAADEAHAIRFIRTVSSLFLSFADSIRPGRITVLIQRLFPLLTETGAFDHGLAANLTAWGIVVDVCKHHQLSIAESLVPWMHQNSVEVGLVYKRLCEDLMTTFANTWIEELKQEVLGIVEIIHLFLNGQHLRPVAAPRGGRGL